MIGERHRLDDFRPHRPQRREKLPRPPDSGECQHLLAGQRQPGPARHQPGRHRTGEPRPALDHRTALRLGSHQHNRVGPCQTCANRLAQRGRSAGVTAAEQGQHAGELETSILLALDPGGVAMERAEAGEVGSLAQGDTQELFYPSLRDKVPSGVLGDPRRAHPGRADGYLEVWADVLVAFYRARIAPVAPIAPIAK